MRIKKEVFFKILECLNDNKKLKELIPNIEIKKTSNPFYQAIIQLHDCGCIDYKNLTSKNYNFWWYEVDINKEKPNKNIFTCNVNDFTITSKAKKIIALRNLKYNKLEKDIRDF